MKKLTLRICIAILALIVTTSAGFAQISIATARAMSIGSTVTVKGIVTNGAELGAIRYMEDGTAGIAAYSTSMSNVMRGDSVTVTGVLKLWSDLLEIDPVTSFTVHSSNNALPVPQLITPNQLGSSNIGELMTIHGVQFSNAGGTFSGNTNYNVIGSGGQNAEVRINLASSLVGKLIPVGAVNLIGISSQYFTTYQLLLRDTNDIIPQASIALTSPVIQTNISTTGFNLGWSTDNPGSTGYYYGLTPQLELGAMNDTNKVTQHIVTFSSFSPAEIYYFQAFSVAGNDTAFSGIRAYATQSLSSGDMKVYFTRTVDNSVASYQNAYQADDALDDTLIAYLNRAQHSIDITVYGFNMTGISNIVTALNNAHTRGVRVRLVHDEGTNASTLMQLSGIYSIGSPGGMQYGIMHNKFVVIDANSADPMEPIVWTGSMNFTDQGVNGNANNVVITQDQSLARAYTIEFEEMWGDTDATPNSANSRFGPDKVDNTPHEFVIGGRRVECYMSPSDGVNEVIKQNIASAEHELAVETMLITRSDIGYAIRDAYQAGASTQVIVNDTGECSVYVNSTLMTYLGSDFREYGESYILHHKLLIADQAHPDSDPLVLTGSHNWSNAADQRNDENTLVIHDSIIPNLYYQEFVDRFALGVVLTGVDEAGIELSPLRIFPNPATEHLSIGLPLEKSSDIHISIFDLGGKLQMEYVEKDFAGNQINLNTSRLSAGMYIITVMRGSKLYNGKLVIE